MSEAPTLSEQTIKIVKETAPIVAEHGATITSTMYGRMLTANPSVKEMFNPAHQVPHGEQKIAKQPQALAAAVHAYAANIDNLGALSAAIELIAQKHVSLYVLPSQYGVVKDNLLWAFGEVLGDALTPEIAGAWTEAYDFLAYVLIERERTLREEKAKAEGGWEGYREFVVSEKKEESPSVTSFVLKPKDEGALLDYVPGSYVAIRVDLPTGRTVRNYTLSSPPNQGVYRLTVKKIAAAGENAPEGQVSSFLHATVNVGDSMHVSVPCGDFLLNTTCEKPIVLLCGGVGVTPVVSMFDHLAITGAKNKVTMIRSSRTAEENLMTEELTTHATDKDNFSVVTLNGLEGGAFRTAADYLEEIKKVAEPDSQFYFCGPTTFMQKVQEALIKYEVPAEQMHFEFFGPLDNL